MQTTRKRLVLHSRCAGTSRAPGHSWGEPATLLDERQEDLARVLDFGAQVEGIETDQITANLSGWVLEIIQPKPRATVQQSQKIAIS